MHPALALGVAYAAGSIPSAYIAGRVLKGIDLRTVGSGNLGATNVYRTLGAPAAVVVLFADALKGGLPAALLPGQLGLTGGPETALVWGLLFGVAAIAGHAKPIFLLWKGGGKGVATAAGVFAALAPAALGLALTAFALVLWRTRIVSAASITAAVVLPMAVSITMGIASPVFAVSLLIGAFVVFTHRTNIQRLRAGTEPRLGRATKEAAR